MIRHFLLAAIIAVMTACNSGTKPKASTAPQAAASDKHSTEYITQRLNDIFTDVYTHRIDLLKADSMYMSADYNRLQNAAMAIAERTDDVVIDADHWVQGQDWTEPAMKVKSVDGITPGAATAVVVITTFPGTPDSRDNTITMPLVFERGDWYIDNMQQQWQGETLDEKAWYRHYISAGGNP